MMDNRGVTRPMAEKSPDHKKGDMDRMKMLKAHHRNTLWIYWTLVGLGIWLLMTPFTFGYLNESLWVDPSGGRGVWFSSETHTELRAWLMVWSDVLSGLVLLFFGWRSLKPNRPISLWICCGVGVWLTFAPVLFWAPTALAYYNSTIIGAVVIALTILIPGMPNMIMYMQMGPSTPKGWSYNPSSWPQRWIMIALGFVGWLVSRYLATYQLGYSTHVWDPFFGFADGTQRVLDSKMSHSLPISDAGLGSIAYTFEFLMGFMGAPSRWRTMPWMVTFFGILVIPLGLVHIFLVISQPVMVGYWCSFCLLAAIIMLPMIPLEFDEVFAMFQHVKEAKARGDRKGSLWSIFWKGGQAGESTEDQRTPMLMKLPDEPASVLNSSIWGFSCPWTLGVCVALGVATMFVPTWFETPQMASHVFHVTGALVVTFSVIAMGELIRATRFANLLLGLILLVAPLLVSGTSLSTQISGAVLGLSIGALSLPRGKILETYGPWQKYIR